jgi:thiamine pyrophosphokinase
MADERAIIFTNGEMPNVDWAKKCISPTDTLIAADGGLNHCLRMGLTPTLLIGDLDSITPQQAEEMAALGCRIDKYPVEKDETDLELALLWAAKKSFATILIFGALGGRIDQTIANLSLLLLPELINLDVRILTEEDECFVINAESTITGSAGDRVSLLPWGGSAIGVTTAGLQYPLRDAILTPDRSRGVSNVMLEDTASVTVESGSLLCVHSRMLDESGIHAR